MKNLKSHQVFRRMCLLNLGQVFAFFLLNSCLLSPAEKSEAAPELIFSGEGLLQNDAVAKILSAKNLLISVSSKAEAFSTYLDEKTQLLQKPYTIRWQVLNEDGAILPECAYYECKKPVTEISADHAAEFNLKLASHLEPKVYTIEVLFYANNRTAQSLNSLKREFFLATPPLLKDDLEISVHHSTNTAAYPKVTVQNDRLEQLYFSPSLNLIPAQSSFIIKSQLGSYHSFGYLEISNFPSWIESILLDGSADLRENSDPSQTLGNKRAVIQNDPLNETTTLSNFIVGLQSSAPAKLEQGVLRLILQDKFSQQRSLEISFSLDPL